MDRANDEADQSAAQTSQGSGADTAASQNWRLHVRELQTVMDGGLRDALSGAVLLLKKPVRSPHTPFHLAGIGRKSWDTACLLRQHEEKSCMHGCLTGSKPCCIANKVGGILCLVSVPTLRVAFPVIIN